MADDTGVDMGPQPGQFIPPTDPTQAQPQASQPPQNELASLDTQPSMQPQLQPQQNELDTSQYAQNLLAGVNPPEYNPPSTPVPDDVKQHMAGLVGKLSKVSSFLAGSTEYKATVNPDGTMSIQSLPSTEKEKWMRIAAAAIGGAAKGFAAGQGPGGAARAISAGYDVGSKIPQQQRQQVQQQVDTNNQQLLDRANLVHIKQQTFLTSQQLRIAGMQYTKDVSDQMAAFEDKLAEAPGNTDWGVVDPSDPNWMTKLQNKNPDLLGQISGRGGKHLLPMPKGDGTIHAITVDNDWMNQRITEPWDLFTVDTDKDGKVTLGKKTIPAGTGGMTPSKIITANLATIDKVGQAQQRQAAADQKDQDKTPTGDYQKSRAAASAARARGDIQEADRLDALANQQLKDAERLKATTTVYPAAYTPPAAGTPSAANIQTTTKSGEPVEGRQWGGGDPTSAFENSSMQLAMGQKLEKDIQLPRSVRGQAQPPNRQDYSNRARQITQDLFPGFSYDPLEITHEYSYYNNEKVTPAFNAMDRLVGPTGRPNDPNNPSLLGQIETQAKRAGIWDTNAPVSSLIQVVQRKWGDAEANALQTDLHDLQANLGSIMGTPGLTGGLTNEKLKFWSDAFNKDLTLKSLASMSREIRTAVGSERASAFRTNRFLARTYGGQSWAPPNFNQQGNPNLNPNPNPNQNQNQNQNKPSRSLSQAMALPGNKGKTRQQVIDDLQHNGYIAVEDDK